MDKKPNELSQEFNKSAQQPPKAVPPKVQSDQVTNQQHGLSNGPKPPGSTRDAVTKQQHNKKMANDNDKSKKASAEYKAKIQRLNKAATEKEAKKSLSQEFNKSAGR